MKYVCSVIVGSVYLLLLIWSFQIADRTLDLMQVKEFTEIERGTTAQNLCVSERGPNSEARLSPEKYLVCTTKRGERKLERTK